MIVFVVVSCHENRESVLAVTKSVGSAFSRIQSEMESWRKDPKVYIVGETWNSVDPYYRVTYYEEGDTRDAPVKWYELYTLERKVEE